LVRGGIEILLFNLFRNVTYSQDNFSLVVFSDGEMDDEFKNAKINVLKLYRKSRIDFQLIKDLRKIIIEKKIDIIHSHQAMEAFYSYLATRGLNVKNVISHHGSIYPFKDKIVMKFLISKMDAHISVSNSYLNRLSVLEGFNTSQNFHVIYNGIDESKLDVTPSCVKKDLKIAESTFVLGMVGNFYNSGRDQYTICQSLPKLYEKFDNIEFIFVGGGSEQNSIYYKKCFDFCKNENLLSRTHFLGVRKDIENILKSLDIFVYSSNHDTFGIAVVEAMLSGLPVVINDIPPMLEISDNGKYAKIYKTKNSESLFTAISELIENKQQRLQLAQKGKKWAMENFTISKHISAIHKLYFQLLN
ncbi:MAG: glycosyltransferase family 4 protein, partial [Ignavibacteriae bacterium]|nr:glycosyltransferase family 4 protein [Ignavibacteriota bacterium]